MSQDGENHEILRSQSIPDLMKQIGRKVIDDLTRAYLVEIGTDPTNINSQTRHEATNGQCIYTCAMAGIAL